MNLQQNYIKYKIQNNSEWSLEKWSITINEKNEINKAITSYNDLQSVQNNLQ